MYGDKTLQVLAIAKFLKCMQFKTQTYVELLLATTFRTQRPYLPNFLLAPVNESRISYATSLRDATNRRHSICITKCLIVPNPEVEKEKSYPHSFFG